MDDGRRIAFTDILVDCMHEQLGKPVAIGNRFLQLSQSAQYILNGDGSLSKKYQSGKFMVLPGDFLQPTLSLCEAMDIRA